jgi:hypothetical protein
MRRGGSRLRTLNMAMLLVVVRGTSTRMLPSSRTRIDRRSRRAGSVSVGRQVVSTSMVTGTPFVMTSNTADLARDCSTISCSFSAGASPLTVNRTVICS